MASLLLVFLDDHLIPKRSSEQFFYGGGLAKELGCHDFPPLPLDSDK